MEHALSSRTAVASSRKLLSGRLPRKRALQASLIDSPRTSPNKEYPLMTDHSTDTTRTPATIAIAIPDGCDTCTVGNPIHVEADVLYKAIDLLQVVVLALDPYKDDDPDPGERYRLRIATRQITTYLEEALLADWPTNYGEPCRTYLADLAGRDAQTRPR